MMKMLISATALVVLSGAALAADLPSKTAPAYAPAMVTVTPSFSWTGFYVGGNFGGAFNNSNWSSVSPPPFASFNTNGSGASVGAIAGYNYQIGNFVAGIEGAAAGV